MRVCLSVSQLTVDSDVFRCTKLRIHVLYIEIYDKDECLCCQEVKLSILPKGVGVVFNIVLDFDFTPILTFPHRGGRDNMAHINTCQGGEFRVF